MKNPLVSKKASPKIQDVQSIIILALLVGFIVLSAVVAVLLAQGIDQRKSINQLTQSVQTLQAGQ